MTEGGKKRLLRATEPSITQYASMESYERDHERQHARNERAWVALRIGDRLRPCPGCERCARPCTGCEGERFEGDICERCGRVATGVEICDGSGVIVKARTT